MHELLGPRTHSAVDGMRLTKGRLSAQRLSVALREVDSRTRVRSSGIQGEQLALGKSA